MDNIIRIDIMKVGRILVLSGVLASVFFAAPGRSSEAEAAFLSQECAQLNHVVFDEMSLAQQRLAQNCSAIEAAKAWEQSYGDLDAEMLVAGVVYE